MIKRKAAVLVSGGLDSAVLLDHAIRRHAFVQPLYVRFGLSWEKAEQFWLKRYLRAVRQPRVRKLVTLDLPVRDTYAPHWSLSRRGVPNYTSRDETVYLPGRNILLLAKASVFCAQNRLTHLYIGTLKNNPFPDSSPRFRGLMESTARKGLSLKLSIHAPFSQKSKNDIVRLGEKLPLHLTFSCLSPKGLHPCGRCNKCAETDKVRSLVDAARRAKKNLL